MSLILSIETATTVCSVALTKGSEVLSKRKLYTDKSHANQLTILIKEMLEQEGFSMNKLDAVAVSEGPGSYTGLRIGISTAKGLCYALNIPLIGVSTLEAMAHEAMIESKFEGMLCPMIDARRMEVYTALYSSDLRHLNQPVAKVLDESSFQETLESSDVLFFGNGAEKFENIVSSSRAQFLRDFSPSAWAVGQLAAKKFDNSSFEDLAYFEPTYLKEFQATTPKPLL